MKHYLKKLEDSIRSHWEQKALCDYGGEQFTYGDIATQIEQFRFFLDESGIAKGEKIALCGRNSARWAMTFWGINANGRVAVPLLADFTPDSIQALVGHSDSVLLFTDEDIWARLIPASMPLSGSASRKGCFQNNLASPGMIWTKLPSSIILPAPPATPRA